MNRIFYRLGQLMYRFRYWVIGIWFVGLIASLPVIPHIMDPFQSSGFENIHSQSFDTNKLLENSVGYQKHRILVLFTKESDTVSNQMMNSEVNKALKKLDHVSYEHKILFQKNKNSTLAVIAFRDNLELNSEDINQLKKLIKKPKHLQVYFGGEDVFVESVNKQTEKDLFRADMIAAPVSILTLLFVFGSVVAALMPMLLGGCCALMMFAILNHLANFMSLSIFTINIALLLGLCLSLDYALFIISRFREELHKEHHHIESVISRTMATAGKAVFFSGLAVFASLSALLLFPINILISVGVGGLCAVFLAVIGAITLLPAVLSTLENKINLGTIFRTGLHQNRFWHHLATGVIAKPILFVLMGFIILVTLALPLQHLKLGISDYHILPENSEGRAFFKAFSKNYDENELSPISVVIQSSTPILKENNIKKAYDLVDKIKQMQDVKKVEGYLSWLPSRSLEDYQKIYSMSKNNLPPEVRKMLATSVSKHVAVIQVISRYSSESDKTQQLVRDLRNLHEEGLDIVVTGVPANNVDVFDGIKDNMLWSVRLIIIVTFFVLMILLRSLFLPFKAIVMNILSLCATYGVLVYVFQQGHFSEILNFEAQGSLDVSMMVIIFCALFGFSMDYEVFLLSRIQECYQHHKNNKLSIVYGIEHSARIITSAAMIVIVLCGSFLVADVLMVKAFGLGIAVAIFIDAFIIRTLLVPAIMTLTASINWYFPSWFSKFMPNHEDKNKV